MRPTNGDGYLAIAALLVVSDEVVATSSSSAFSGSRSLSVLEAGRFEPLPPGTARLEVDRNEPQPIRDAEAELDQALSLPGLRTRPVDLEDAQAGGDRRLALGESVEARSEDDLLADAVAGPLDDESLDEAGTGHDGGAEGARELRIHIRTAAPRH